VRRLIAAAWLCAILAGGGCGEDEEAPSRSQKAPALTVPAGGTVRIVGKEYSFEPSEVEVKGAGPLTLTLRNEGALAHNVKVVKDEQELGGTPTFPGGRTESGRVNLEHGNYRMLCTVGDHAELGMVGTLRVR
jgi:plastocyanin